MTDIKTVHVIIVGRVQGVGYRAWTVGTANDIGLNGWVRNRHDGSVEAVFSGPEDDVERMLDECDEGPPGANVNHLDITEYSEDIEEGFVHKPTV